MLESEQIAVLEEAHKGVIGGHFSGHITSKKIFQARLWWPSVIKDSFTFVWNCEQCQRDDTPKPTDRMSHHPVLPLKPF